MILSKEKLLEEGDFRYETFTIGPLGGEVIMREFSAKTRLDTLRRFEEASEADDEEVSQRALLALAVCSLCNEDKSQMFPTEAEQTEAVDVLMEKKGTSGVDELMDKARKFHGLAPEAMSDAVGNSDASQSESSRSGSLETSDTPELMTSQAG